VPKKAPTPSSSDDDSDDEEVVAKAIHKPVTLVKKASPSSEDDDSDDDSSSEEVPVKANAATESSGSDSDVEMEAPPANANKGVFYVLFSRRPVMFTSHQVSAKLRMIRPPHPKKSSSPTAMLQLPPNLLKKSRASLLAVWIGVSIMTV
jgi:hypothetical protein